MKKVFAGALIALACVLIYHSYKDHNEEQATLRENSMLIQQQIDNVAKLIVTEGHFAEVYNYADSKELFGSYITADKTALVVVNAHVTISYDLKSVDFQLDETRKAVVISHIPDPEISINPDFEYYDVTADYFNPFDAKDYNQIKRNVKASLLKKVESSSLVTNAQNRLVSELSQLLLLTHTMGWTLEYDQQPIDNVKGLQLLR